MTLTMRIVEKAFRQINSIRREYMMFTSAEGALRIVLNPTTHKLITQEFWEEQRQRGLGVHQGYWVESLETTRDGKMQLDDRMLGIKVMTDESVPEDEVELRAILVRSWEAV